MFMGEKSSKELVADLKITRRCINGRMGGGQGEGGPGEDHGVEAIKIFYLFLYVFHDPPSILWINPRPAVGSAWNFCLFADGWAKRTNTGGGGKGHFVGIGIELFMEAIYSTE